MGTALPLLCPLEATGKAAPEATDDPRPLRPHEPGVGRGGGRRPAPALAHLRCKVLWASQQVEIQGTLAATQSGTYTTVAQLITPNVPDHGFAMSFRVSR
jgi:hypothetical protein